MDLPFVDVDRQRLADPRPARAFHRTLGFEPLLDVVGRALAIGVAVGVLFLTGPGTVSLAVIGTLAVGAALLSWSD